MTTGAPPSTSRALGAEEQEAVEKSGQPDELNLFHAANAAVGSVEGSVNAEVSSCGC